MASERARLLRQNMTDAEKALWQALRDKRFHGLRARRQHPIGPYVVDFYCAARMTAIEVDGGQHSPDTDGDRDAFLESKGLNIIRYWNNDVLQNLDGVPRQLETDLGLN